MKPAGVLNFCGHRISIKRKCEAVVNETSVDLTPKIASHVNYLSNQVGCLHTKQ